MPTQSVKGSTHSPAYFLGHFYPSLPRPRVLEPLVPVQLELLHEWASSLAG